MAARQTWLLLLSLLAAGCAHAPQLPPPAGPAEVSADEAGARVTAIADEVLMQAILRNPEYGTHLGLPIADHAGLTDNSPSARREWRELEDAWWERLGGVDPDVLRGRREWITYGFLHEMLASARQSRVCRSELWGVSHLFGWHTQYPFLARIQPVGSPALRQAALARFGALPGFVDHEIEALREGLQLGYTAPRGNVERVIAQVEGLLSPPPARSPYMSPAERDGDGEFATAFEEVVRERINPALQRYLDFLRLEYLPRARTEVAVSALPDGEACYRAAVRGFVTLDVPPREIHEIGLREMAQIREEMRVIAERSFGTSDVQALLQRLRSDPQFTFASREEIIARSEAAIERARVAVPDWFGIVPRAPVVVEPYPAFEEASAPMGSYVAAPDDGSRPAIYRINTFEPTRVSRAPIESTAFHEAYPGHHLQIAIAREQEGNHMITRYVGNSGFSEGWALYAERLADEMGLFSGDLDRLGMLSNDALRAARLVVDAGIHALGWSRQQAIDYMVRHTAESPEQVAIEVDRYIIMPGQAVSYMLGRIEIQRLRAHAERELGEGFDIREFHDRVLENGGVTLPMLRQQIEDWVARRR
jgi:uncharacterized protein (DUF885 family)